MVLHAYRPRKVIGAILMIIGGLPMLVVLLFVLLAVADEQPVELCLIVVGLLSLVAMGIWKRTRQVVPPLLLCLAVGYFCYYRWFTPEGVLAGYGVYYDNDPDSPPFASSSLNSVRFWFEGPKGRLLGPVLDGDMISVEKPYRTRDGHLEFAVRSRVERNAPALIQLLSPPQGEVAFRVVEQGAMMHVLYSLQPNLLSP